ncbi:hypothetical protein ASJ79_28695 [Mycobacterium sp. NAZ190054]|nr:hypothetical protein ASJ79_28695 [Mycobacterium sp. NAZ190054]
MCIKPGALHYFVEHDLSETAKTIDTTQTALHVVAAEYDWPSPPARCQALAAEVEGATYTLMEGVGHFSMSENPEVLKKHFLPLLDSIVAS